jgi:hypothetical protein
MVIDDSLDVHPWSLIAGGIGIDLFIVAGVGNIQIA